MSAMGTATLMMMSWESNWETELAMFGGAPETGSKTGGIGREDHRAVGGFLKLDVGRLQ
jgi:hypothetical protein